MEDARETICALASGSLPAALATVRVSGPGVRQVIENIVKIESLAPRRASIRTLWDRDGARIDQALCIYMPGPNSYTGEDVIELTVHGGRAVVDQLLDALVALPGVRLAEPGEFTRRAFENGRMDLIEAEGVADLIDAETAAQKTLALAQVDGEMSRRIADWRGGLIEAMALIAAATDFADEEDAPDEVSAPVRARLERLSSDIEAALGDGHLGERIRDGWRIAILGAPNAGKSTLLNRFARREASIVTDIPGTTRDVVEIRTKLAGQIVWMADTAGLRETDDIVEAEGVRRARAWAEGADIRVHLVEPGRYKPDDIGVNDILVANKADLGEQAASGALIAVSAKTGAGLEVLEAELVSRIEHRSAYSEAPIITRRRHRTSLEAARDELIEAIRLLDSGLGLEFVSEHVRRSGEALAALVGAVGVETILGAVFSEFCIGK